MTGKPSSRRVPSKIRGTLSIRVPDVMRMGHLTAGLLTTV